MSNIQFNEGDNNANYYSTEEKGMVGWLIKKGWVKDSAGANKILLGVAVVCFLLAIWSFMSNNQAPEQSPVDDTPIPGEEI